MYLLELTEEQLRSLLSVLDRELRSGGLESLPTVVDLHNVIANARKYDTLNQATEPVVVEEKNANP